MKVEFIRPGAGFGLGYHTGEVASMDDDKARKLIEAGVVIPAKEKAEKETADSKAPKEKKEKAEK